jgi:hypothetical protein
MTADARRYPRLKENAMHDDGKTKAEKLADEMATAMR